MKLVSIYRRVAVYMMTTFVITAMAQLESLNFDFEHIGKNTWITILLKSFLPGVISIKAYFDTTAQDNNEISNSDK